MTLISVALEKVNEAKGIRVTTVKTVTDEVNNDPVVFQQVTPF